MKSEEEIRRRCGDDRVGLYMPCTRYEWNGRGE